MAFFPHVNRGDSFQPNSVLENNLRDLVNASSRIGGRSTKGSANSSLRVPVWNSSDDTLPAGSAVTIDATSEEESPTGVLPCIPFDGSSQCWGILPTELPAGGVGDCIIGGISLVPIKTKAKVGDCVAPVMVEKGAVEEFAAVPCSPARLIYGDGKVGIMQFSEPGYRGYFKAVIMFTEGGVPTGDKSDSSSSSSSSSRSSSSSSSSSGSSSSSSSSNDPDWLGGSGILGLSNGKLVLYPTGSCKDDSSGSDAPDDPNSSSDDPPGSSSSSSDSSASSSSSSSSSLSADSDSSSSGGDIDEDEGIMLAIVDGADYEASSCGFIDMGSRHIAVPRCCFKDWQQKRNMYIYLESGGFGVTFKMESSYPTPTDSKFRRLIARLIYKNGAYSVIQEQHGPIIENYHMMLGGLSVIG